MSDWEALEFFARKVRERAQERIASGLPPEPPPTREEIIAKMVENHNQPNAFLARIRRTT